MDMQFVVRSTDLTVENQEKRVQYYGKLDPEKRVYIGKSQRGIFSKIFPGRAENLQWRMCLCCIHNGYP